MLARARVLDECQGVVRRFLESARKRLTHLPPCPDREALLDLTQFLSQQTSLLGV
jgi:hypothetical protein